MSDKKQENHIIEESPVNEDNSPEFDIGETDNSDKEEVFGSQDEENISQEEEEQEEITVINEEDNLYKSYKHLIEQVVKFNKEIHTMMTILRYQYDHYSWWNIAVNIIIITMSSVITFLESLRANVTLGEDMTLVFNIITITFGFLIALTLAIFKFLKVQDSMEEVRSGILTLEMPYKDSCEIYLEICNKIFGQIYSMSRQSSDGSIQMMTDEDNEIMKKNLLKLEKTEEVEEEEKKEFESFLTEWKQTRIKSIYPELQVQQLLTQMQLYDYWKKYLLQDLKNIKMVNRRNFDIKLYEESQLKMTKLKLNMMNKMNQLVEDRRSKNLTVKEIEHIWEGDMVLLDRLEDNYKNIMLQSNQDKIKCCPRGWLCYKGINQCCTSFRDCFRLCGCCKKGGLTDEDKERIYNSRYDKNGKLVEDINSKENEVAHMV